MQKTKSIVLLCIYFCLINTNANAQLTEMKPFDTSKNESASADRIFADAIKENMLNNRKESEVLLHRFLEAKPNVAAAYYELARINLKDNKIPTALQNIKKAISLDSTNKWYLELYANILVTTNQNVEAAKTFEKLAQKFEPNDEYWYKSALNYKQAKKDSNAIFAFEQLIKSKGISEEWLIQIHQLYLRDNNIPKAAATLQRLIDAFPQVGRYYALLAELYLNHQEPEKAKTIFEKAEKIFPNDISVMLGLASYYKHKNDSVKYTEYVNKSITNNTIDEQTQITLLVSYLQEMGKDSIARENAYALCQKLIIQHPENATLQAISGDLLSLKGENKAAATAFKKSLSLDPNNLNIWQQYLFSLTSKSDADSLNFYCDEALGLFPSSAMLHYLKGIAYHNKENDLEAIKSFETAIDFQPEDNKTLLAEMYSSLADAYHSLKNYEQADKNFEKALKLNPENASVLNNYAYYLSVRKNRLDDAEKMSAKSLVLRPGDPTFLDTYGWIFFQKGQYAKAQKLIEEAIEKLGEETDETLYDHLGDIYFKNNNLNKAIENWQKALNKSPNNIEIAKKIKNKKIDE